MRKITSVLSLPLLSLVMSFASGFSSSIAGKEIKAQKLISSDTKTAQVLTNVKDQVAAQINVTYEFYKMDNTTSLFTHFVPAYSLIYRMDIFLNNKVKYKGGVGSWFSGENPCYLQSISVSADFTGSNISRAFLTPNISDFDFLEVNPYLGEQNVENNCIGTPRYMSTSEIHSFETAYHLDSTSYALSTTQLTRDYVNKGIRNDDMDSRLCCLLLPSATISDNKNKVEFSQIFRYGYQYYFDTEDNCYSAKPIAQQNNMNFFSGPKEYNGPIDSLPFNFSIYGALNFQSDTEPKISNLNIEFDTVYGSMVWLDSFKGNLTIDFK